MARSEAAVLRRVLAGLERGRGKRVPAALKQRVARYARARHAAGVGYRELGEQLGLSPETTRRWCAAADRGRKRASAKRGLVAVELVPGHGRAVLVSPGGYRVEGLDLQQLATLLRALS